jgi:phosphoadenosine phosphosulfate reductase
LTKICLRILYKHIENKGMPLTAFLNADEVHSLADQFESASPEAILGWSWQQYGGRAAIGTSFQGAGLVAIHHAVNAQIPLPVFSIDTGLLFAETLELKQRLEAFFGVSIESLVPELSLEQQAIEYGPALWERQPDLCCTLRKVFPLQAKLGTLDAWITGVRRDQSSGRARTRVIELYEFDKLREKYILKVNPMANWSRDQIWEYIRAHKIPYNPLADRGFRSIGCQPCTRAVGTGDDERAGRWTGFEKVECGMHTFLGENI